MGVKRRRFTREFKLQVVREVESGKSVAHVAREYQLHPTMINRWRREHMRYAEHAFSGNGSSVKSETRVAELERMVGQLTMENPPVGGLKKALLQLESRLRVGNGAGER